MKKNIHIILILVVISSCTRKVETVNIGFRTKIVASKSNVIPFRSETDSIFATCLKSKAFPQYLGKIFMLFDTVFTSTITYDFSGDYSNLLDMDKILINENENNLDFKSLLYRTDGYYVYRTLIPEKDQKQLIIADITSRDSVKIKGYFTSQKLKGSIVK
jgi:hypothetical protein